jgi:predicted transcriptional regulator
VSKEIELHVGGSFNDIAARVADSWHRAEQGLPVSEDHLTFVDWDVFSSSMTGKRLELLRYLHKNPQASIAALARALGRDYRRVHEDVEILARAGLVEQDEQGLRAGYDEIRTVIAL